MDDARPDRWGERVIRLLERPPRLSLLEMLYFAGDGFRLDEVDYLAMFLTPQQLASAAREDEALRAASVKVGDVTSLLRERFAASCLIFDTHFRVLKRP